MGGINSNVILMLHGDGPDGGTAIIDATGKICSAITTTTVSALKWGGRGAISFGTNGYINVPSGFALSNQDFTIDFRWKPKFSTKADTGGRLCGAFLSANTRWNIFANNNGVYMFVMEAGNNETCASGMIVSNLETSFHHYAFTRSSGYLRAFFNGSLVDSIIMNNSIFFGSFQIGRGTYDGATWQYAKGTLDEFRIVKGVAVWTEDFTPPTEPYSPDIPATQLSLNTPNVLPLFVQNQEIQIANRFRYDAVRKIPDMSAAQVRAVLMGAGYVFNPDYDHDFTSIEAYSLASVRLYPTITEDYDSDVASIYLSDIPWSGPAEMAGMVFTVAKNTVAEVDSRIVLYLKGEGSQSGYVFTDSGKGSLLVTARGTDVYTATNNKKIGDAAILFNGGTLSIPATSYLCIPESTDFTIEAFVYLNSFVNASWAGIITGGDSDVVLRWTAYLRNIAAATQSGIGFQMNDLNSIRTVSMHAACEIKTSTWHHIVWQRQSGSTWRVFLSGVSITVGHAAGVNSNPATHLSFADRMITIGGRADLWGGMTIGAYIDELTVFKGLAVYSDNFIPRSAPFPKSIPYSGETIIGYLSYETIIPENESIIAQGVSLRIV